MSYTMKKTVSEIITGLKKLPEPGKKTGSFWDFMKSQLADEGQWDQNHIKVIEKEIDTFLGKVDKRSLTEMWKETPAGDEKFDEEKKIDIKEMKTDLSDEIIGRVMDQMDDNYSSRDSFFIQDVPLFETEKSVEKTEDDDLDLDKEPEVIPDEEIDLDDSDLFDEGEEEDDEIKF
jgi:hypothetical protein